MYVVVKISHDFIIVKTELWIHRNLLQYVLHIHTVSNSITQFLRIILDT